jgi:hypothetical protein
VTRLLLTALILILPALPVPINPASSADSPQQVTEALRIKDQQLLDAIAPGNVGVWDAAMANDAIYVDENGAMLHRAEFLKQLTPLPQGATGKLVIRNYTVTVHNDTATVIHTDDEDENYHGQRLKATYLTTETWQNTGEDWKLLLVHTYSIPHQPPTQKIDARDLPSYAGRYAAGDLLYTIRVEGDHLLGAHAGKASAVLNQEVRDVFFVTGQLRTRKIFQRDAAGKVTGFVDRREGTDLLWTKTQ